MDNIEKLRFDIDSSLEIDKVIEDWIKCNEVCDLAMPKRRKKEGLEKADRYMEILPGAEYVLTQTLNYIFSNGITTGSINEDERLNEFLYRKNARENLNLAELRSSIGMAITHGASGIRWLDGNIYQYKWGTYRVLTYLEDGIEKVLGYVVSKKEEKVPYFDFKKDEFFEYEDFVRRLDDSGLMLLTTDEFMVIRNDTSLPYGYSPLLKDEARLDLMTAVYERLNYDIRYDGPGRIIIRPKDGYAENGEEVSTATVMKDGLETEVDRVKRIKAEVKRVAEELKDSSSDSVVVLSNAFDKDIVHLPRVTKATEFLEWLENDTAILAQDMGMAPSLLELGHISGNVSMNSILDNSMLNSIVPLRERYATQFSSFLANHLDVGKIYFNLYEMQQAEDVNSIRTKWVNMMAQLNAMTDADGVIRPEAAELFKDYSEMLKLNITNENGVLEEL